MRKDLGSGRDLTGSVRSFRLVHTEAHFQCHLEVAESLVFDVSADVGDLEPIEIVKRVRSSLDGATDSIIDPRFGRTDDLADGVSIFSHDEFMPSAQGF